MAAAASRRAAAAPVRLDDSGATQHGKFAGKKVAVVAKVAPDAKFLAPHCTTMIEKVCRTWTYSAALTTRAYASMPAPAPDLGARRLKLRRHRWLNRARRRPPRRARTRSTHRCRR